MPRVINLRLSAARLRNIGSTPTFLALTKTARSTCDPYSPVCSPFLASKKQSALSSQIFLGSLNSQLLNQQNVVSSSRLKSFSKAMASSSAPSSNFLEDGARKHTNRLAKEQSPYLLQHAHNPVDWYPWGEEAFTKARAEDKLIFLSVGYSTCHWCHVMEVESFESEEVAKILNDHFVSIKVDREERPDVDKVYMTYVQATQGGGGWPMNVFLTPNLHPVLGGTYFPPEDKYGRVGIKTLLKRINDVWRERKSEMVAGGQEAMRQLSQATQVSAAGQQLEKSLAAKVIDKCAKQMADRFDPKLGGFGGAPKFPRPSEINLMLRQYKRLQGAAETGKQREAERALSMSLATLDAMGRGGMHDHVGGGFHRYSVDEHWHVPHFEKMLYDQAQLVYSYLDAFAITGVSRYALLARDVLDYLRRDMTHEEGGIFSAEDADSYEREGVERKKEGAFYVWTLQELEEELGAEDGAIFASHYYVKAEGNCDLSPMSDPHHEFSGLNVLIERQTVADTAKKFGRSEDDVAALLGEARRKLHEKRGKRPRPHLDDKVIVSWNGLAISAFARASVILKSEPLDLPFLFPVDGCDTSEYLASATRAATFVHQNLYDPATHRLTRSFRQSPSDAAGFIDDYAFLICGLLDLFEAGGDTQWLQWALDLQSAQDELLLDKEGGGYFSVPLGDSSILLRMKEDYDGAEPSGNSAAVANLQRLSTIVEGEQSEKFLKTAEHAVAVFEERLTKMPLALPQMCCSLDQLSAPAKRQVIIAGPKGGEDASRLLAAAFAVFEPLKIVLQIDDQDDKDRDFWQKHNKNVFEMARRTKDGRAAAYICQNFTCQAPTSDPGWVEHLLRQPIDGGLKVSSVDVLAALKK